MSHQCLMVCILKHHCSVYVNNRIVSKLLYESHNMYVFREKMDENDCCTLTFKTRRLHLDLLQHQDDSLATEHYEVVNSSTNNAQHMLHHVVLQLRHQHFITSTWCSTDCNTMCGCGTCSWKYVDT